MDNFGFASLGLSVSMTKYYPLRPVGIGSIQIEGLNSYVKRLASAHFVKISTLLSKDIAPTLHLSHPETLTSQLNTSTTNLNSGITELSANVIEPLEELTKINHLANHTMNFWSNVLSPKFLTKKELSWCPICFNEMHSKKEVMYEPLLWHLEPVTACTIHRCKLETKCPTCKSTLKILDYLSRPGYCHECGQLLANDQSEQIKENELEWQEWVQNNLGEMLNYKKIYDLKPGITVFQENFKSYTKQFDNLNNLSRVTGINVSVLEKYKYGLPPTLPNLLILSYCFQSSVLKIITGDQTSVIPSKLIKPVFTRNKLNRKKDDNNLELRLKSILKKPGAIPAIKEIAREYNLTVGQLFESYPSEIHQIAMRRKSAQKEELLKNQRQIILQTAHKLRLQGYNPSMELIELMLDESLFHHNELKTWYQEKVILRLKKAKVS